ncbi:glutaminyl-peptide cyclotransferase [Hyphococcus flavus]|uniref:Glutaminyl-peptide cyclotransferase n=1 Tax=Hyphococcus flavus TaxID=1866326 RepID=A0AAE9ZD03_9PROT|nr:glutaminyl-peptide cyclotransferase [Hyphococcus flavus]WDI32708.1 glutaminyl-peptide cyclotransferase [Hyphococcus flavus]
MRPNLVILIAALFSAQCACASEPVEPTIYDYRILETYPHATDGFTQGLFFDGDTLVESTGLFGESSLRRVELDSGEVVQSAALAPEIFGEGSAIIDDDIFVISWRNGKAFRFDAKSFEMEESFKYEGEGWGLTNNGNELVMSDGTDQLRFLDPLDFSEKRRTQVTLRGEPLGKLNELEWVEGEIYANIWLTNVLARIDPETGAVTGLVDLRGLLPEKDFIQGQTDVLNGIAYNGEENILYVTGKNWPKLFKIELVEKP